MFNFLQTLLPLCLDSRNIFRILNIKKSRTEMASFLMNLHWSFQTTPLLTRLCLLISMGIASLGIHSLHSISNFLSCWRQLLLVSHQILLLTSLLMLIIGLFTVPNLSKNYLPQPSISSSEKIWTSVIMSPFLLLIPMHMHNLLFFTLQNTPRDSADEYWSARLCTPCKNVAEYQAGEINWQPSSLVGRYFPDWCYIPTKNNVLWEINWQPPTPL